MNDANPADPNRKAADVVDRNPALDSNRRPEPVVNENKNLGNALSPELVIADAQIDWLNPDHNVPLAQVDQLVEATWRDPANPNVNWRHGIKTLLVSTDVYRAITTKKLNDGSTTILQYVERNSAIAKAGVDGRVRIMEARPDADVRKPGQSRPADA